MPSTSRRRLAMACFGTLVVLAGTGPGIAASAAPSPTPTSTITTTGLTPGEIKHVWLIVLDDKSFDAAFTGLNHNDYLANTLRKQGALLRQYYATGHYSMDDYISMVSGQAPEPDTQNDCNGPASNVGSDTAIADNGTNGIVDTPGVDYGQVISRPGPNSPETGSAATTNGCVYPLDVPTLFNQFNAAGVTWKGYAQDLGNVTDREQATSCGYPGGPSNSPDANPTNLSTPAGDVTSFTGPQPNDQYVASHFPFPWFHALTGGTTGDTAYSPLNEPGPGETNCDGNHIANLDSPTSGLYHDLQSEATTPAFSWISPDDCSNSHEAACTGNNLSGAFTSSGAPDYTPSGLPAYQPEATTPANYTGGLYASDLFLSYYIPLIEASPAFADGGLIDITFDEAAPPFTYSGDSFNDANAFKATAGDQPNSTQGLAADQAGETIADRAQRYEPTGPMTPRATDGNGFQLFPGPGDNAYIDRSSTPVGPSMQNVDGEPGTSTIDDDAITAKDRGRGVTDSVDVPNPLGAGPVFVGPVTDTGPLFPTTPGGAVVQSSFQLVDSSGKPVTLTGRVTQITLSSQTTDPLYDPYNPTPGGGRTGSLLIGPSIKAGTVSLVRYNHYSWLRTMEDIFDVVEGDGTAALPAGTVSGGVDGEGHLGMAGQAGLWPFGRDVFTDEQHPAMPPPLPPPASPNHLTSRMMSR